MEQNCFDRWSFAIVFLRAKHAGAVVVKMLFLTPPISWNIDLPPMTQGTKKLLPVIVWIAKLKQLELALLSPPWPDSEEKRKKKQMKND